MTKFNEMSEEKRRAIALAGSQASAKKRAALRAAGLPTRKPINKPQPVMCKRGRHEMTPDNIGTTRRVSGDGVERTQSYCKACRREYTMARAAKLRAIRRDKQLGRS